MKRKMTARKALSYIKKIIGNEKPNHTAIVAEQARSLAINYQKLFFEGEKIFTQRIEPGKRSEFVLFLDTAKVD